ncbi:putative nucleoporin [Aspergillus melleus]|uniref:putative nucleoporin n=1 Tax=Aspergillus melleus TaxID=138277 RepID=UPI001E8D3419|nr:Nucleoporin nup57 [Aspergillus melleus]KAH8426130.1 Nucleoporin nup57 [Aspergillus melleus]
MSLFGGAAAQPQAGANPSPFGAAVAKPSPFGSTGTSGTGLFGSNTTGNQQGGGLLGGQSQNQQGSTGGGLFGSTTTQQQPQQQQNTGTIFGSAVTQPAKPAGSLFGGLGGQQQQNSSPFGTLGGSSTQQQPPQPSLFGGSLLGGQQQAGQPQQQQQQPQAQQQQQQPQLGQTIGQQQQGSSLWSPGRAVTGVHRTVPMQMQIVREKWDANTRSSPFRTYLYNNVGEEAAPFYQPSADDDDTKWEDALRQRPGSGYVPVLVKGFFELGKRAQRQKDFLTMMQTRLHEINNCLTDLLSRHDLKISVKIADCRRKHLVLSKRCLALAAKTQVLRNRGYAMDDAEEELKKKLAQLERSVFDPSLNGRAEEIWARMLAIREQSKRLQAEIERAGPSAASQAEDELDENTMKAAKKILDDYHTQIQHLHKEMESVKKDLEEAQKLQGRVGS